MRTLALLFTVGAATLAWTAPALAQVGDAERAAARDLFKQGDELQRAGKFAEALDKFERAQQIFSAPTNMLRIAECEAALGRLVESAESYRAVVRTPLPAGSPPPFQAAVDQARGELAQVAPRVPKVVVQVQPAGLSSEQLQIDGQNVPAALVGEPIPLDPGTHKVIVFAPGYASTEQSITLKERDSKSVQVTLEPIPGITYAPGAPPPAGGAAQPPAQSTAPAPTGNIPPPPPPIEDTTEPAKKKSRTGLLFGGHLGLEMPSGHIPMPMSSPEASVGVGDLSGSGFAYGLDGGVRFARQWYIGLTLEHASLDPGKNPGSIAAGVTSDSSDTTQLGLVLGLIVNPDKTSFLAEVGVAERWYSFSWADQNGAKQTNSYSSGELSLGAGLWIPIGHVLRLVPEATAGLGSFNTPTANNSSPGTSTGNSSGGQSHAFFMLGVGGFYNIDL